MSLMFESCSLMVQAVAKVVDVPLSSSRDAGAGGLCKEVLLGSGCKHPHLVATLDCAAVTGQVRHLAGGELVGACSGRATGML
jgi:hypothetical protein